MKTKSKYIRIIFWVMLGMIILFTSLALTRPQPTVQDATVTPTVSVDGTPVTTEAQEDVGSTDGIMLMAVVIVLIVIVPILLRRKDWSNGRRKK
jgi:hypothetical protein